MWCCEVQPGEVHCERCTVCHAGCIIQVDSLHERAVVSLFPCACVRELWVLLRCTLDRLAEGSNSKVCVRGVCVCVCVCERERERVSEKHLPLSLPSSPSGCFSRRCLWRWCTTLTLRKKVRQPTYPFSSCSSFTPPLPSRLCLHCSQ